MGAVDMFDWTYFLKWRKSEVTTESVSLDQERHVLGARCCTISRGLELSWTPDWAMMPLLEVQGSSRAREQRLVQMTLPDILQ